MDDLSKLTDKQINEGMQSFPNSMVILDKKGKRKLIDYVNDDGFCMRIVKENRYTISPITQDHVDIWTVWGFTLSGDTLSSQGDNLNRAILLTYLKIREGIDE